jgi:hypothetical protein
VPFVAVFEVFEGPEVSEVIEKAEMVAEMVAEMLEGMNTLETIGVVPEVWPEGEMSEAIVRAMAMELLGSFPMLCFPIPTGFPFPCP